MSGGAVACCRNLGENRTLIEDGVTGVLAGTQSEWVEKLSLLITDAERRRGIAARGLELVRSEFSVERCFERLLDVLAYGLQDDEPRAGGIPACR